MNEIEKIVSDLSDRDVINIEFVALNKEQEQVERPLELWKFYLPGCGTHKTVLRNTVPKPQCSNRNEQSETEFYTVHCAADFSKWCVAGCLLRPE